MTLKTAIPEAAALILGLSFALVAQAQQPNAVWKPSGPVTIMYPFGTAGGPNAIVRGVAERLSRDWGQPVTVENVTGSEGLVGTRKFIASAKPDGRTFLVQVSSIVLTKHLPGLGGIDPVQDLVPVAGIASAPFMLVASKQLPGNTLSELIKACTGAATPCSIGASGNVGRMASLQFAKQVGIPDMVAVNYRDSTSLLNDLLGGRLTFSLTGVGAVLPHYKAGTLKAVALAAPTRFKELADVSTTREAGLPDFEYLYWTAVFAPKGTPPEITRGLAAAVREAVKVPQVNNIAHTVGAEMMFASGEELAKHLQSESARFDELVKLYPIK